MILTLFASLIINPISVLSILKKQKQSNKNKNKKILQQCQLYLGMFYLSGLVFLFYTPEMLRARKSIAELVCGNRSPGSRGHEGERTEK